MQKCVLSAISNLEG